MNPSDKVAVLRDLLTRVRANARDPGALGVPPSSGRAAQAAVEAEATAATSMRLAMRPPPEDRWDFAPPPIDDPVDLTPIDLPQVSALEPAYALPPSDPPVDRHDSGGVLLDLDPGELPEIEARKSIPPLSPLPPRLRAVESAASSDPEAMRFWLSALTTPKSSPPLGRDTIPDETVADDSRFVETEPAEQPSERSAAIADAETAELPRAPRLPRWSEPHRETPAPPTPTPSQPMSGRRSDTSSPGMVTPASERVGRTTNGPFSRRRSVRVRLRAPTRATEPEKSSRWLRGALGLAAGAAIGIIAYRVFNPHAVHVDEASLAPPIEVVSRVAALAPSAATAAARTPGGAASVTRMPTEAPSARVEAAPSPASSELVAAAAAPIPPPPPLELGVPAPSLAEDRGRLIVHSKSRSTVYVNGVRSGSTNAPFDVPCGMRNVRLAKEGWPPPGKSFPMWSSTGITVMVPCRAAFEIDLEPD